MSELNNQAANNNEHESKPGGKRDVLLEHEAAAQDADQRKERDIDAQQPGKVPFDHVDDQAIAPQRQAACRDERKAAPSQPRANDGIPTHLQ